ncbi:hypothetical protein SD72_08055 [Leucobacter komagatae]|uniref:Carbohydrate kinase PfkB domain-containing protein n=1 Tax=Leucobacter komagatae TaxID=55969 RepID=A0A0D0INQ7_9MICO|nr:hypothetical protein SD72_08055 [Leucobacter komagatae]
MLIGEALVDIIDDAGIRREYVGGSPTNTAIGVARLGLRAELLTSVGRDDRGERIAALLAAESVELLPASWHAGATSTALATIASDGSASYSFDIAWTLPAAETRAVDLVHAGSIGLFLEPGGTEVLRVLRERAADCLITLDPNIRPSLLGDRDAALGRFVEAAKVADLVKLSDEDAAWLYPGCAPEQAASSIRELGPRIVVVTLGGEGALAVSASGMTRISAVPVVVADTISAGDSFMACLIASLLELSLAGVELELEAVLSRAAHAAAIAVSAAGANPPSRAALDAAAGSMPKAE